jgi:hypothetical protein
MKIEETKVRKLHVTEVYKSHGLDPIHIYLEDYESGKGKITISCYDKTWHSYWGGMSDRTIAQFFLSCDNGYIAKNLSSINSDIPDYEKLKDKIKEFYKDDYDEGDFYGEISEMLDDLSELEGCQVDGENWVRNNTKVMTEVFGYDWYYDIPTMINPKYKYLCRIIDLTKEALREISL